MKIMTAELQLIEWCIRGKFPDDMCVHVHVCVFWYAVVQASRQFIGSGKAEGIELLLSEGKSQKHQPTNQTNQLREILIYFYHYLKDR